MLPSVSQATSVGWRNWPGTGGRANVVVPSSASVTTRARFMVPPLRTSNFLLLQRQPLHAPVRHLADQQLVLAAAVDRVGEAELLRQLAGGSELADDLPIE